MSHARVVEEIAETVELDLIHVGGEKKKRLLFRLPPTTEATFDANFSPELRFSISHFLGNSVHYLLVLL